MKRLFAFSLTVCAGILLHAQQPEGSDHPLANKRQVLVNATSPDATTPVPEQGAVPAPTPGEPAPGQPALGDAPPATPAEPAPSPAPAVEEGDAVPQAYRSDRYAATWDKNPFLIKVAASTQAVASFAEDWELKYLTERSGTVKAGIQNRKTQEYRNISTEPDAEGFQLVSAKISRNRKESEAEISKGSEKATFKYNDTAPPPAAMAARGGAMPGGPPGAPRPGSAAQNAYRTNPQGAMNQAGMQPQRQGVQPGQQPGMVPTGGVPSPNAPPSAINRRRVLTPAPAPPNTPVP